MESILQSKLVFTADRGFYLSEDNLVKANRAYYLVIPVQPDKSEQDKSEIEEKIRITDQSVYVFLSKAKFFYAIKGDNDIYSLTVIKDPDVKQFRKKQLDLEKTETKSSYISKGTFGSVIGYPAEQLAYKTGVHMGIKPDFIREIAVYNLFKEFKCMPKFHDTFISYDKTAVIVLDKGLSTLDKANLNYDFSKLAIFQILKCMRAFQSQGVAHLDLKPQNILVEQTKKEGITTSINTQIIDWGLCIVDHCPDSYQNDMGRKQTLIWSSPEVLIEDEYNYKADIFSIGIMLTEMTILETKDNFYPRMFGGNGNTTSQKYENALISKLLKASINNLRVHDVVNFPASLKKIIALNIARENSGVFEVITPLGFDFKEFDNKISTIIFDKNIVELTEIISFIDEMLKNVESESGYLLDLVSSMLEFNPRLRIDYHDAITHPYFQNIKRPSYGEFPIFLNKMEKLNLEEIYDDYTWEFRSDLIKDLFFMNKSSPEAAFLTVQLYDILNSRLERKEIIDSLGSITEACLYIARSIYEAKYYDPSVFLSLNYTNNNDNKYYKFMNSLLRYIKVLDYKLIIPSLYSYWVYYNKELPSSKQTEDMFQFYNEFNCYEVDFETKSKDF